LPLGNQCSKHIFQLYYFTKRVNVNFENFYKNQNNVFSNFVEMWKLIANFFKNDENVVGYDLINEPWPGNVLENPDLILNGTLGDTFFLEPFYEILQKEIRKIDPNHLIFFEPAVTNNFQSGFKTGILLFLYRTWWKRIQFKSNFIF
jgi:endoglycosylceramidase